VSAGRFRSSVTSQRVGKIEESAASGCNTVGWLRKLKSLPPAKRMGAIPRLPNQFPRLLTVSGRSNATQIKKRCLTLAVGHGLRSN